VRPRGKLRKNIIKETAVDYTYYDYLDLAPGASSARIETAYAQLLERFGYGTTDDGQDFSGLVRMVHAAYQVLSNADTRREYDATLDQEAAMADAELKAALDQQPKWLPRVVQDVPVPLESAIRALAA
jgi:DnaJ-class molecular chaperone